MYTCACAFAATRRLRQFPLYSKKEPPEILAPHFTQEVFEKSQRYGRDKAKFSLVAGLYKQCLDSVVLQLGFYAWSWTLAEKLITRAGYGSQHEVCHFVYRRKEC
jgi:STE24 endopeptidase